MMMQLIPLDGGSAILVDKPILFFGRHPDCDVVLTNSRKVSRKHCCLAVIDDYFVIRDLGSMNGLRLNGEAVRKEAKVKVGDEFHVGDVGFRVQQVTEMPKRGSAANPPAPAAASNPPAAPGPPKPAVRPGPPSRGEARYLSQDLPVAIPDQMAEFLVEETQPKMRPVAKPATPPAKSKRPPDSDDVIELGDSDIIDH